MILNREDALYDSDIFVEYFQNFNRIDDYLRYSENSSVCQTILPLCLAWAQDDMFDDFSIHQIWVVCREISTEIFVNYLEITTSRRDV